MGDEMEILLRRFTIIALLAAIFAFAFATAVERAADRPQRVHLGSAAPCYHPASVNCVAAI